MTSVLTSLFIILTVAEKASRYPQSKELKQVRTFENAWEGSKHKNFARFCRRHTCTLPNERSKRQAEAEFLLSLPRFMDHNAASVFERWMIVFITRSAEVKTKERNPLQPSEGRKTNDIPAREDN